MMLNKVHVPRGTSARLTGNHVSPARDFLPAVGMLLEDLNFAFNEGYRALLLCCYINISCFIISACVLLLYRLRKSPRQLAQYEKGKCSHFLIPPSCNDSDMEVDDDDLDDALREPGDGS